MKIRTLIALATMARAYRRHAQAIAATATDLKYAHAPQITANTAQIAGIFADRVEGARAIAAAAISTQIDAGKAKTLAKIARVTFLPYINRQKRLATAAFGRAAALIPPKQEKPNTARKSPPKAKPAPPPPSHQAGPDTLQ